MGKFERIYWKSNFNWKEYAKLYYKYSKTKDNYYLKSSNEILNNISINENSKVVDLACGNGALTALLLKKYPKINIFAIDLSEEMLKYYKDNFRNQINNGQIKVIHGNAEKLSTFTKEKYDFILISSALWDLDFKVLLKDLNKVLKNGGKIVFNLPALVIGKEKGFIFFIEHFFRQALGSDIIYRRIKVNDLINSFSENGFKVVKMKDYSFNISKNNVSEFFNVLRYRYPFILFPEDIPYSQKLKRCTEVFNDSLRYIPKEGLNEEGVIFIVKKNNF